MVKIGLQIKLQLENVAKVTPEGDDFRWYLKLKCSNCSEETKEFVFINLLEMAPLKGGRGHASMVLKCKLCSRENSIDIIKESITSYTDNDENSFKTIVAFDCRGVEPTDFSPRTGWSVEAAESGSKFKEVNLLEKEWADFDERSKQSVGIYELEHQFVKV